MMTVTVDQQGSVNRFCFVTRILPLASLLVDYQFGLILRTTKVLYLVSRTSNATSARTEIYETGVIRAGSGEPWMGLFASVWVWLFS